MLNVITCFIRISETEDRNNINCYYDENPSQDQLERPPMVHLVELNWLNVRVQVNSLFNFKLTLSIRKIRVRLRAMRAPFTSEKIQMKTNCAVIAKGEGRGANKNAINTLPT